MLIELIGCPCSGKTTTAAGIFSVLKDEGTPAEFISEQARLYIARRRFEEDIGPHDRVKLDDSDQIVIMQTQYQIERAFKYACGPEVVVVSDTSPLSAILYMNKEMWQAPFIRSLARAAAEQVDLVFYSHPVQRLSALLDPNRIHTLEQSLAINAEIPAMLAEFAPSITPIPLYGDAQQRLALAMREICARRG